MKKKLFKKTNYIQKKKYICETKSSLYEMNGMWMVTMCGQPKMSQREKKSETTKLVMKTKRRQRIKLATAHHGNVRSLIACAARVTAMEIEANLYIISFCICFQSFFSIFSFQSRDPSPFLEYIYLFCRTETKNKDKNKPSKRSYKPTKKKPQN